MKRRALLRLGLTAMAMKGVITVAKSSSEKAKELSGKRWVLWYRQPARNWNEALPLGNGRMGAMVFGGVAQERLQLNEDTMWSGYPYDPTNPDAFAFLEQVRQLVFAGKYREAEQLADQKMMGVLKIGDRLYAPFRRLMAYQPLGDLWLSFPHDAEPTEYRRELDLDEAIARIRYRIGEVTFTREIFLSAVDQALVCRIVADKPKQVTFTARLTTPHPNHETMKGGDDWFILRGQWVGDGEVRRSQTDLPGKGIRFEIWLAAQAEGGKVEVSGEALTVKEANAVTLLLVAATSYRNPKDISADPHQRCADYFAPLRRKSYPRLKSAHIADHQRLLSARGH
jgi:alpha-L-fucosidase 2